MPKCKGIISLRDRSKLSCNKYTPDPIRFIIDHIHLQRKDNSYVYLFDGSKYLSVRNDRKNVIRQLNDPMEFAILWHSEGGEIDGNYDKIIDELKSINDAYFGSRYSIDDVRYKTFLNKLDAEYNKNPREHKLSDVINTSITLVKNPVSSIDMESVIAVIYYMISSDVVGTLIAIESINEID